MLPAVDLFLFIKKKCTDFMGIFILLEVLVALIQLISHVFKIRISRNYC